MKFRRNTSMQFFYLLDSNKLCKGSISEKNYFRNLSLFFVKFSIFIILSEIGCFLTRESFLLLFFYVGSLLVYLDDRTIHYDSMCKIALDFSGKIAKHFSYDMIFHEIGIQLSQKRVDIIPDNYTEIEGYLAFLEICGMDKGKFINGFTKLYAATEF